jgi:hypothetical protein
MTRDPSRRAALAAAFVAVAPCAAQIGREAEPKLPDGKSQKEAILKAEFEKALSEAAELLDLAQELKIELEKNQRHVLSVASLRKTEEIEKLAKRIRSRLRRF